MTIRDILKAEPQSIGIFRKYGFDSPSFAECSVEQACWRNSIDPQVVKNELFRPYSALKEIEGAFLQLVDDILQQHDTIKKIIPFVYEAFVAAMHHSKDHSVELVAAGSKFEVLVDHLEVHLYKEESILFPEFINLWKKLHLTEYQPPFPMKYPIKSLEGEHERAKRTLADIRMLIPFYNMPESSDKYFMSLCQGIKSFEREMLKLIELENLMLFPETLNLEKIFIND